MNRGVSEAMLRAAYEKGRSQWIPASILADTERTERDWQEVKGELTAALAAEPGAAGGQRPRLEDEWHEDHGDVVWWTWKGDEWLNEPSYIGSPLDTAWPGYHTHWTPHPAFPAAPHQSGESGNGSGGAK